MQAAKQAVKEFLYLHRDQHHNTEVREIFNPAVTKETVRPVERDEQTTAIDRELHQDHHQTRIQPIEDHVRAKERHTHNVLPVERREVRHGKDAEVKRKLEEETRQFKSTSTVLPTEHTTMPTATIAGEHVHHHVHEKVQPVIEREIIQPTVIHTTVPIHERIEHEPTFHPATVQPKMTMEEFRKAGGVLEGKPETRGVFEGEPQVRENGGAYQTHPNAYSTGHHVGNPSTSIRDQQLRDTPSSTGDNFNTSSTHRTADDGIMRTGSPTIGTKCGNMRTDIPAPARGAQQMRNEGGMRTPPIGAH